MKPVVKFGVALLVGLVLMWGSSKAFAVAEEGGKAGADKPKHARPQVELSDAAKAALKAEFPDLSVARAREMKKGEAKIYMVMLAAGEKKGPMTTVMVTDAGVIERVEAQVTEDQLPEVVKAALDKNADGATVKMIMRKEERTGKDGAKLDKAVVAYDVMLAKDKAVGKLRIKDDGSVAAPVKWQEVKERAPRDEKKPKPEAKPKAEREPKAGE